MGMSRTVVEVSGNGATVWLVSGPGQLAGAVIALRSPLTGAWLVQAEDTYPAGWVASWRCPSLPDARRSALGGNGRLIGGHSEVSMVRRKDTHRVLVMAGV
jgi:hypothetical protein